MTMTATVMRPPTAAAAATTTPSVHVADLHLPEVSMVTKSAKQMKCQLWGGTINLTPRDSSPGDFGDIVAKQNEAQRLILTVTLFSVLADVALASIGLVLAVKRGSAAIYAFSAECLLDVLSSLIVVWQFNGKPTKYKEFLACHLVAVSFVASGVAVIGKGCSGIVHREHPVTMPLLMGLSLIASAVCSCLALAKLWVACRVMKLACGVSARTIVLDAVGSLLSVFCALSALIGLTAYRSHHNLWFLESTMTSVAGLLMVATGGRVIYEYRAR